MKRLINRIFGQDSGDIPPSYERSSLPVVRRPEPVVPAADRESIKQGLLGSLDWYNPFVLDGQMVRLKADWMKDFHYYRHRHIFQGILNSVGPLDGRSVLDIGCNEGYYSFAASELGAERVVGLELREENLDRARQLRDFFGYANCDFAQGSVTDASILELGSFDIVFCFGVLYHLENPMIGLRNLKRLTGSALVVDSALTSLDMGPFITVGSEPVENLRAGETGVTFYPSLGALEMMLKCGGFEVETLPPTEPAFWSPHCAHDYRRNQATLICRHAGSVSGDSGKV